MHRLPRSKSGVTGRRLWTAGACVLAALIAPLSAALGQAEPSVTVRPADSPAPGVLLIVDGKLVELESAQIQRGMQVMVWLRDLEKLGWGTVEASSPDRVTFKGKGVTLSFTKGQGVAMVNSLAVQLPINVYLRDGRLMVPLSFVAKALGFDYKCQERPVATIVTEPPKTPARAVNTLQGTVTYNGHGVDGVIVRAVDPEFTVVKNAVARTDANGDYKIEGLPDGKYMAYVYIGDNPAYFNRASEVVEVRGGGVFQVPDIALGRVIVPARPKPGSEIRPAQKGTVDFSWTACEGAAVYKLTIKKRGSDKPIYEVSTPRPSADVPAGLFARGTTYEAEVKAQNENGDFLGGTAGPGGKLWTFSASR